MAEDKYTPGPWRIGDINTDPDAGVVGEIAVCADTDRSSHGYCTPAVAIPFGDHSAAREMALANARLIAAAPALLEALREIADFPYVGTQASQKVETIARAAIAKATGCVD